MTDKDTPIYEGGWLGPDEEKKAWYQARRMEEVASFETGGGYGGFHYNEFFEVADQLPQMKITLKGRPFTWELERRLHKTDRLPWELIPTHTQDTGNCVAAALAGAGMKLQVIEIAMQGEEEEFRPWFTPWIYAVSRNQIGSGMNGAGSTGAWGARAVNEYGVLFSDDKSVPGYPGTSDDWGHRRNKGNISQAKYGKFAETAADNPVSITRARSVDEMTELMDAGMTLTIASNRGFKVSEYKGLHVYRPSGSWMHQMHITDIRRDPELMFYRMNQWGPRHTKPLNSETPGGAWNFASDLDKELSGRYIEVYGYKKFKGQPGGPSYHII
ncbi:MAG: hypothetical protein GY906_23960 [bacterium]|nr:hypothetical protein [bacterium]